MHNWPAALLRLGLLLTALGVIPAIVQALLFPEASAVLTSMLLISVAPLGAIILGVAVILYLVAVFRRR